MLVLCLCPFLCETPRWLAKHGQTEKARHVIARLLDKNDDDPEVKGQLNEILDNIAIEAEDGEPTWGEVFSNATKSRNLQRVVLGMGPVCMILPPPGSSADHKLLCLVHDESVEWY